MRLARAAGVTVAACAVAWAVAIMVTYVRIIRWSATIDEDTLATVHPIHPRSPQQ